MEVCALTRTLKLVSLAHSLVTTDEPASVAVMCLALDYAAENLDDSELPDLIATIENKAAENVDADDDIEDINTEDTTTSTASVGILAKVAKIKKVA